MCRSFLGSVFGEPSMELSHFDTCCTFYERAPCAAGHGSVLRGILDNLRVWQRREPLKVLFPRQFIPTSWTWQKKLLAQEDSKLVDLAAYLVGAVLEDGLRRIAGRHPTIKVRESDNISSLNSKLADAEVYDTLWRRKLHVWDGVRSNADHGHFGRNAPNDVEQNAGWRFRDFLAIFLLDSAIGGALALRGYHLSLACC